MRLLSAFLLASLITSVSGQSPAKLQLQTATGHPMQYYISKPDKWNASRQWPVVVVFEAAEKMYLENLQRFITARGDMPFILVAPIHTNNGNQGRRDPALFPYSKETWDYIDKVGDCTFNDEGIAMIISDVKKLYNGEEKVFITGFEAGAHIVWQLTLNHPEMLRASAPVAGNYRSRCVDENNISGNASRSNLPVMAFASDRDDSFGPRSALYSQWTAARDLAIKNGYENVSETIVKGKGHVPLPNEVMSYFFSLL
jgi:poly(3-hydroxybutyrate) depolymerase